jgi:hypothetical protein
MGTGGSYLWGKAEGASPLISIYSFVVKNTWSYTSTPPYVYMELYLIKHGDNFTFTFEIRAVS